MIQINPLKSYIDGGVRAAITTPPSASLVFDLPGKAIWVKGVKLKGTDHTYTFSHDNYITLTNTSNSNESEDIKIGVNTSALKNAIDTTYGVVSTTINGLAPKFTSENKQAATAATTYYFLGWTGSTLKWYQAPFRNVRINSETTDRLGVNNTDPLIISSGNGISVTWDSTNKKIVITNTQPDVNHNTHYTTMLYIGENNDTKANKNVVNPYLKLFDDSIRRATFQIKAGNGIAVTSDANGNITITNSSPDVNHNTDRTGIKLATVSGTKKTDSTLILANSATGLNIQGGTNKFLIGDGTNYIEVPITPSFTVSNKDATIGTTLTTIATIAGVDIKAKIASYSLSNHTHSVTINGSTKTITTSGTVDLGNYLPLSGGTMNGTAWIRWADSGNISNNNEGVTFPVIRGGLQWNGQTDYVKLFSEETGRDNLNLVLQFGDDNSNGLSIRDKSNTQTSYISSSGVITTGTFKGNLDWSYITNKPSSYTPSSHTHAWNSLTHSSITENQAILTNGSTNGWKLYTLNISGWNNAANNAHSHSNKSVLDGITSTLVNNWNTAYTFVNTISGTDTDKVINKWDEIVNFLAGITEDNKLNTLLNSKLSVYELANNTNVGAIKNNGIYYSTSDASSGTLTNSPFNTGFALINMTSLDNGDDLRRSRLAFNAYGEVKVSDDRDQANTVETWYNVLTSKNSGINGSTIKLNGTSITVYSSGTADGRYVKKAGDTMSGVLTIDTTNFGALTIKRNDDANGASIQFRGKSNVYGYIGLNNSTKNKQFLRWDSNASITYTILDTSSTYVSSGKGVINGTTITQVDNATNSTNSTNATNARKLVNWYSTRPTSLNTQFGDGSLRIFHATSSTTEGKSPNDATILHLSWDNNGGWDAQLGINSPSGRVYSRAQNSGTWQSWKTLAFTTDIPSSLKNPYSFNVFGVIYDGSAAKVVGPSNFISQINEGTSTITDGTMFITSYASNNGFADTNAVNVPYKRKAIHLWEYIKAKTDSLYTTKSHNHDDRYLKLTGGTMSGQISSSYSVGTWIGGCTNAILKATADGYNSLICAPIKSGNISISAWTAEDNLNFGYAKKGKTENSFDTRMYWDAPNNNLHAAAFTGHLYGTADNATNASNADTTDGVHLEWSGQLTYDQYSWLAAWTSDGKKIKAINKSQFATSGHTHDDKYLRLSGGTMIGNIILKGGTSADMTYAGNIHPYIRFDNSDSSQNISLIFTDYDDYRRPAGIKLVGNQGNEWFEVANIYANMFYGTLSGNATTATTLQTTRTLWGQAFNGSANVSGNMSGVGQISFSSLSGTNGRALLYQGMADNDFFRIYVGGTASNSGYAEIATADDGNEPIYVRQYSGVFNSVVRTLTLLDANGYSHFPSYINIGGNENNNYSPDRVWGSNGSDSYLRSYRTSALNVAYAASAGNATVLLTNNTAQAADACYNENPGLRFWRYNGTSSTTGQGGGDGWIMSWSWNSGSVGGQIYVDDNPTKIMCIRGRNNDANKTFTTWATILHSDNYTSYCATKSHIHPYLPLSGGTISGRLLVNYDSNSYGAPAIAINYYDSYSVDDYSIAQIKMGTPKYDAYLGLSQATKGYYGKVGYFMHIASDCEFLWGTSGWTKRMALECSSGNLWVNGSVTARGFIKSGSSDSYVLLGGGGHKLESNLSVAYSKHLIGITLTGGNGNNSGYRLIFEKTMGAWDLNYGVWAIAFRHSGRGILNIGFDTTNSDGSTYTYNIRFFGSTTARESTPFRAFYNTTTKVFRIYWHYYDYTSGDISVLRGNMEPYNGAWITSLPDDIGTELTITCNIADQATNADMLDGYHASAFATSGHTHAYLPLAGGTMTSNARISHENGNLYLGRADNNGWLMCQDICSHNASGDSYWSLRVDGTFHAKNTTLSGTCDIRNQNGGTTSGLISHKILCYPSAYYGLITRIYTTGCTSLQVQRESSDSEVFPLSLNPLGGNVGIGTTSPSSKLTVNGDISLFNNGSIKNLTIGGGIYWNPYVESTTDGSDAASITVVRQGVAGGTTLVLSQMNDSNDTIQFKTSTAARLYHNSYPILTTQNTYVSNNKGYINGVEITQVNNASSATTATKLASSGYANNALSYYQTDQSFDGSATGWSHYIIANHGNGSSYYHYTIRLPFWSVPQYRRQTGNTSNVTSWYNFITAENISSQSVNYATSAGNADTVDGLHVHGGKNNEANKIVRTDGNGFIQAGWINTTSGDMGTTAINKIYCSNDSYIRYKTPANFFETLSNDGNQISITIGSQNRKLTVNYASFTKTLDKVFLPSSTSNAANTAWCKFARITFNNSAWSAASGYLFFGGCENPDNRAILVYHFRSGNTATTLSTANLYWLVKSYSNATVIAVKAADNVYDLYTNNAGTYMSPCIYHMSAFSNKFTWSVGNWTTTKPTAAYTSSDIGIVNYANSAGNADTLDNYHANGLLTALSNSNNGISITVGGTTKSISNISVNYANSAGNADKVDGQHFNWNNNKNDHTYLWAASNNGNAYLVHRASISVNYANSAGNADKLDGNHASAFALVGHTHNYDNVYSKLGHTHDDRYYTESEINSKLSAYLPLAGGTMTGQIKGNNKGGSWIHGRANAALYQPRNVQGDWHPVVGFKTKTGSWEFGSVGYDDNASFSWESDSNYNSGTNTTTVVYLRNTGGTIALTSEIPTVTNYYWANMKVSSTSSTSTSPTFSTCYTSNWFRSTGQTGWYNETYAGGWYMTDTSWVRTYNSKGIYTNTGTIYNLGHAYLACNNGYNVGIGTASPSYKLHVSGDSYTTGWSRAASGFYCQDTGVHFTHNGTKGQIAITSNNEFCWGAKSNILYFNYATASQGTTVTQYVWNAGSSTSYASHTMGHITLGNGSYQLKRVAYASSWYNGRDRAIVRQTSASDYSAVISSKTTNGSWEIGNRSNNLYFTYITDTNYNSATNVWGAQLYFSSSGSMYATHFYENSDIRYKKILKNLSINYNIIANLPLFDFEWIENNTIGTGTSAQAVQQILPNLVSGTNKLTLDYGVLGTIAGITACKELVTQKSELQQLKEKVKQLEDKLRKYENI